MILTVFFATLIAEGLAANPGIDSANFPLLRCQDDPDARFSPAPG